MIGYHSSRPHVDTRRGDGGGLIHTVTPPHTHHKWEGLGERESGEQSVPFGIHLIGDLPKSHCGAGGDMKQPSGLGMESGGPFLFATPSPVPFT